MSTPADLIAHAQRYRSDYQDRHDDLIIALADALEAAVTLIEQAVALQHTPMELTIGVHMCAYCNHRWPCPTEVWRSAATRLLEGETAMATVEVRWVAGPNERFVEGFLDAQVGGYVQVSRPWGAAEAIEAGRVVSYRIEDEGASAVLTVEVPDRLLIEVWPEAMPTQDVLADVEPAARRALPDPHTEPTIKVERSAEILGISRGAAFAAVKDGTIPSLRIGRRIVVPTATLLKMIGIEG